MNNDRLEKLRSLLQTVNESITKQEFVTSFKAVLDFVKQIDAKNTAEFDNIKVQFKHLASSLKLANKDELDDLKAMVNSTLKDCMAEMMVEHDAKMQAMDVKMSQVRDGVDGIDGVDADETKVVEMVLAKIPAVELDAPLDIVEKLESLQGEYRLDASAIKNLPDGKGGRWGGGLSRGVADTLYAPIGTTGGGVDTANSPLANEFARFTDTDTIEGLTVAETLTALGFTASITELNYTDGVTSSIQDQINTKANSSGALTQFVGNTAWRVFYSDGSGDITELALGADGTFLKSNGAAVAPSFATPAGSGDVSKVGTPVNNQVGVWTGDGTIEGDAAFTFDTTTDVLSSGGLLLSGLTASELVITDGSKNLVSAAVATYPSLTELTYLKGVTSAIQTQLNAKAPSTSPTFATSITGSYLTASEILITDGSKNIVSAPIATYPSLTELTYLKGVTSAIQTQLNNKQGLDTQLTDLAGLAYTGNSLKVVRVNAGETGFELATVSGGTLAIGDTITSATAGSIFFAGVAGVLAQDNAKFFFDNTNDYLGIGTATPDRTIHAEIEDAVTAAVTYVQRLTHTSSGSAANSFGVGTEYELENVAGTNRVGATLEAYYIDATNASEDVGLRVRQMREGTITTTTTFVANQARLFTGTTGTGLVIAGSGGTSAIVTANNEFDFIPNTSSDIGLRVITASVIGTSDLFFQAKPGASGYGVFEGYGGQGTVISSDSRVLIAPGRTEYVRWEGSTMTFKDAINIAVNGTTGTKIGTATSQKFGFWNVTPIVQPANTVAIDDLLVNTGLRASGGTANFTTDVSVPDEAYGVGWNGSLEVPTKNALYDKIETLGGGSGITRTVVTTSGSLTLGSTASVDYTYYVAGAHTLSMPSPNTNRYTIKNIHSAAITIDTAGAENIEGAANISLEPNDSVDIMSDGTNWYVH